MRQCIASDSASTCCHFANKLRLFCVRMDKKLRVECRVATADAESSLHTFPELSEIPYKRRKPNYTFKRLASLHLTTQSVRAAKVSEFFQAVVRKQFGQPQATL